jgi:hypothetical protein
LVAVLAGIRSAFRAGRVPPIEELKSDYVSGEPPPEFERTPPGAGAMAGSLA